MKWTLYVSALWAISSMPHNTHSFPLFVPAGKVRPLQSRLDGRSKAPRDWPIEDKIWHCTDMRGFVWKDCVK